MIALAGWKKFWHARAELADYKAKYASMTDNYRRLMMCLDAANQREEALQRDIDAHVELLGRVEDERNEARREVDGVRAALVWLEKDFKVGGAA